ncbi:MAG: nucleoside triphosphate pyrophosphatase [Corynebacterium sp.]|nr:nucleoside triphosphate pyrophosphatase [Corynebacterium sp.]
MIILASSSPSRKAILESAGITPLVIPAEVSEEAILHANWKRDSPSFHATRALLPIAEAKARESLRTLRRERPLTADDLIIAADSMLFIDGDLQGKPRTKEVFLERWRNQAGKTGELITAHCLISGAGHVWKEVVSSTIFFSNPNEKDLEAYAESGEALECAGAFTLEARGGWFIDRVEGDTTAILGLSLPVIRRAAYSFGLSISQFW